MKEVSSEDEQNELEVLISKSVSSDSEYENVGAKRPFSQVVKHQDDHEEIDVDLKKYKTNHYAETAVCS